MKVLDGAVEKKEREWEGEIVCVRKIPALVYASVLFPIRSGG